MIRECSFLLHSQGYHFVLEVCAPPDQCAGANLELTWVQGQPGHAHHPRDINYYFIMIVSTIGIILIIICLTILIRIIIMMISNIIASSSSNTIIYYCIFTNACILFLGSTYDYPCVYH